MPECEDHRAMNRRAFLERFGLGAGAAMAGGALLSTLPQSAAAASGPAPPNAVDQLAMAQMQAGAFGVPLNADPPAASSQASLVTNPNILIIMVDQLRAPQLWTTLAQQATINGVTPATYFLRRNSYWFQQFNAAATQCTPSRANLLTGLYAPQTGQMDTDNSTTNPHVLDSRFPTFGSALANLSAMTGGSNPNYNCFWFGKWHLSDYFAAGSIAAYGFNNTSGVTPPQWPDQNGSPDGTANEGNNGVLPGVSPPSDPQSLACDAAIAGDFIAKYPTFPTTAPWCAVVSLVNPHDITHYPGFFSPAIPTGTQGALEDPVDFKPHYGSYPGEYAGTPLYTAQPSYFNDEDPNQVAAKGLTLQSWYLTRENDSVGAIATPWPSPGPPWTTPPQQPSNFIDFLNWYFYMYQLVDQQIDQVLQTVLGSNYKTGGNPSSNTAIIFLADHGEYGGSHGFRGKGGAVYDEAIRIPLYVVLPSQTGQFMRRQMCSAVDFFRLVVELAIGAPQTNAWWTTAGKASEASVGPYADQAARQSLLTFLAGSDESNGETRTVSFQGHSTPYILTTTDELLVDNSQPYPCGMQNHVICMRTKSYDNKSDPQAYFSGSKYAIYNKWVLGGGPAIDGSVSSQIEFYDYTYAGCHNRLEVGNDTTSPPSSLQTAMASALGNGPVQNGQTIQLPTGLVATELMAGPVGVLADGTTTLESVSTDALSAYNNYVLGVNTGCSS